MKLSISNLAWQKEEDEEMYKICKCMGYDGIEIAPSRIFGENPYQNLDKVDNYRSFLKEKYKLNVSSIQSIWYGKQGFLFQNDYEMFIDYTKKIIEFAKVIGATNIVLGCPKNRKVFHIEDYQRGIDFFKRMAEYAEKNNTIFSIEANPAIYDTNYINYTLEAMAIVKYIGSEYLKINLDIGTMIYNGEDIQMIQDHINLINHVHISEPQLRLIERRELHRQLLYILKHKDYKNYVSIEMASQSVEAIKRIMKYIAELCKTETL